MIKAKLVRKRPKRYYDLHEGRNVVISGSLNDELVAEVIPSILLMAKDAPLEEINVFINTSGGDLNAMFAIHDVLKSIPCPIHTIGLGYVMSAGILLLACGNKRSIYENTMVLMHEPFFSCEGVSIRQLSDEQKINSNMRNRMISLLAKYIKKEEKTITADLSLGDLNMTAMEAVTYGISDDLVKIYKS